MTHASYLIQEADRPRRKSFADSQSKLASKAELQELDTQSGADALEQLLMCCSFQCLLPFTLVVKALIGHFAV